MTPSPTTTHTGVRVLSMARRGFEDVEIAALVGIPITEVRTVLNAEAERQAEAGGWMTRHCDETWRTARTP